jgi:hypothetical protein
MKMNMIEKVARALCKEFIKLNSPNHSSNTIERAIENSWPCYIETAKAAIEAMKEPTEEMSQAYDSYWSGNAEHFNKEAWGWAIDKALNE